MSELKLQKRNKEAIERSLWLLLFVGFFTVSFTVGSETEIPQAEQEQLKQEIVKKLETAKASSDSSFIFLNNVFIGLLMVIPFGIGIIIGLASAFVTGLTVGGFELDYPAYLLLYTTPFGFIELMAYSLAMSSSLMLTKKILKSRKPKGFEMLVNENKRKNGLKRELKFYGATVGIVVGLIFIGGIIENYMIGIVT